MCPESNVKRFVGRGMWLVITVTAVMVFSQTVLAQSGRQKKPVPKATPTLATPEKDAANDKTSLTTSSTTTANEPKAETSAQTEPIKPTLRILSVIVNAQSIIPDGHYWSSDVKYTVKDCMGALKERTRLSIVRGGMRNRGEAIMRAKMEKDAYVLWMEINMKDRLMNSPEVNFIEYFLFMPQTAEILTQGKVDPKNITHIAEGGTRVPKSVSKAPSSPDSQLSAGAREVANRVRRWL